jgi:hypothetical protein
MQDSAPEEQRAAECPPDAVGELRAELAALQRQRAWTEEQHRRWGEERRALVDEVHRLRLQLAETDGEGAETRRAATEIAVAGQAARTRIAEMEAPGWFQQQRQSWAEERRVLLAGLEEYKSWNAELQRAKAWFEQQNQAWEQDRLSLVHGLEETQAWNLELQKAKTWYEEQKQAWEEERKNLLRHW